MTERSRLPSIRVHDVVVGIDYSKSCKNALAAAFTIAERRAGSKVYVMAVTEDPKTGPPEQKQLILQQALTTLDQYVEGHLNQSKVAFNTANLKTRVSIGEPAAEIMALATEVNANLIVLGKHKRSGANATSPGSVTSQVMEAAPCSVLVVRGEDNGSS
ncbi:MAG TPA: universal stress protein [Polyangiaceae bacterium]|jgi:nucleotide-binding universal stress UspA family protein